MTRARAVKVSHKVLAQTLVMLQAGSVTANQLSMLTGVHRVTAQEWLRALRKAGAVYVGDWLPDTKGRDATPVYRLGPGTDRPRHRFTRAEISERYRQRQREKTRAPV